ncbi:hypothetical protein LRE75_33390 [Streptomyces sp. 372A]
MRSLTHLALVALALSGCAAPADSHEGTRCLLGSAKELREAGCDEDDVKSAVEREDELRAAAAFRTWLRNGNGTEYEQHDVAALTRIRVRDYPLRASERGDTPCFVDLYFTFSADRNSRVIAGILADAYERYAVAELPNTTDCEIVMMQEG